MLCFVFVYDCCLVFLSFYCSRAFYHFLLHKYNWCFLPLLKFLVLCCFQRMMFLYCGFYKLSLHSCLRGGITWFFGKSLQTESLCLQNKQQFWLCFDWSTNISGMINTIITKKQIILGSMSKLFLMWFRMAWIYICKKMVSSAEIFINVAKLCA